MASEILIRRQNLAGWTFDTDWTDPANPPPDNARRLKFTSSTVRIALVGKSDTTDAATNVDVGALTINGWLGIEIGSSIVRGQSIVETNAGELSAQVLIAFDDVVPGSTGWLNIANLTNVGGLAALWVYIVSGARPV